MNNSVQLKRFSLLLLVWTLDVSYENREWNWRNRLYAAHFIGYAWLFPPSFLRSPSKLFFSPAISLVYSSDDSYFLPAFSTLIRHHDERTNYIICPLFACRHDVLRERKRKNSMRWKFTPSRSTDAQEHLLRGKKMGSFAARCVFYHYKATWWRIIWCKAK